MSPYTEFLPKELLPVGGMPLLFHALEECAAVSVSEIALILRRGKRGLLALARAWAKQKGWRGKLFSLEQKEAKGVGEALLLAKEFATAPFFWLMPDNVCVKSPLRAISEIFEKSGKGVFAVRKVEGREKKITSDSGSLTVEKRGAFFRVVHVEAKRRGTFQKRRGTLLRSVGRTLLLPSIFPFLEPPAQGEFDDAPAYDRMASAGKLCAYFVQEKVFDCGHWKGWLAANQFFLPR